MNSTSMEPRSSNPKLGLIGIGLMGTALAERLLNAGVNVIGWDRVPERRAALTSLGGVCAASASEVLAACDRVLLTRMPHSVI